MFKIKLIFVVMDANLKVPVISYASNLSLFLHFISKYLALFTLNNRFVSPHLQLRPLLWAFQENRILSSMTSWYDILHADVCTWIEKNTIGSQTLQCLGSLKLLCYLYWSLNDRGMNQVGVKLNSYYRCCHSVMIYLLLSYFKYNWA